jgi:hypothetical protein
MGLPILYRLASNVAANNDATLPAMFTANSAWRGSGFTRRLPWPWASFGLSEPANTLFLGMRALALYKFSK